MTGLVSRSIRSNREKKRGCTVGKWQACSWADQTPGAGRRLRSGCGISQTIGTIIEGVFSMTVIKEFMSFISNLLQNFASHYNMAQPGRNQNSTRIEQMKRINTDFYKFFINQC